MTSLAILTSLLFFWSSNIFLKRSKHQDWKSRRWKVLLAGLAPIAMLTGGPIALFGLVPVIFSRNTIKNSLKKGEIGDDLSTFMKESKSICKSSEKSIERTMSLIDRVSLSKSKGPVKDYILKMLNRQLLVQRKRAENNYLQFGSIEKQLNGGEKNMNYFAVSEVQLPDGRTRYEVGRDLTKDQVAEIKAVLRNKLEADVSDPELFGIANKTNNDLSRDFSSDRVPFFFTKKEGTLEYVGASLDSFTIGVKTDSITIENNKSAESLQEVESQAEGQGDLVTLDIEAKDNTEGESAGESNDVVEMSISDYIRDTNKTLSSKINADEKGVGEMEDMGYPGCLHMEPLGTTAVALTMDGVVLAYAVPGEDGEIRMLGSDAMKGTRQQKHLASALNERLKGAETIQEWCETARDIVVSSSNISSANLAYSERERYKDSVRIRKNRRNRILSTDTKAVKALRNGIRR